MRLQNRLAALERLVPPPRTDLCPGCGQTPEERWGWRIGPDFPPCDVCGAIVVTLEQFLAGRGRHGGAAA